MRGNPFVLERKLQANHQSIWKALTNKDQMREWYFELKEFRPEMGFEFSFMAGPPGKSYKHICKITRLEPERKIAYSWKYEGYEGDSELQFELFPESETSTRLKLTHSGLDSFPDSNPDLRPGNFAEGWNQIIQSLAEFVEADLFTKSIELPIPASQVWQILTEPMHVAEWASAFSEGTYVETDWKEGSEVLWKTKEGITGAKGFMEKLVKNALLVVRFYDDVNAKTGDDLGNYRESFSLEEANGKTVLTIQSGPQPVKFVKSQAPLWENALKKINEIATGGTFSGY